MNPVAPTAYNAGNENTFRQATKRDLDRCLKRNTDIEFVDNRIILRSPDGSRWALSASDAGALTLVAV